MSKTIFLTVIKLCIFHQIIQHLEPNPEQYLTKFKILMTNPRLIHAHSQLISTDHQHRI